MSRMPAVGRALPGGDAGRANPGRGRWRHGQRGARCPLALGWLHTVEAAAREVASLRRAHALDEHLARWLLVRYAARRKELQERLDTAYHSSEALERQQEVEELRARRQQASTSPTRAEDG